VNDRVAPGMNCKAFRYNSLPPFSLFLFLSACSWEMERARVRVRVRARACVCMYVCLLGETRRKTATCTLTVKYNSALLFVQYLQREFNMQINTWQNDTNCSRGLGVASPDFIFRPRSCLLSISPSMQLRSETTRVNSSRCSFPARAN